jgi:predicted O-linked N-acetylglucosamine transferase (SPINDLY family)
MVKNQTSVWFFFCGQAADADVGTLSLSSVSCTLLGGNSSQRPIDFFMASSNIIQSISVNDALQQALAHHSAGELSEAERLYRAILRALPSHAEANHNLGVLALQTGRVDVALPHLKLALEAAPQQERFWLDYIEALIRYDRADLARRVFRQGRQSGGRGDAWDMLDKRFQQDGLAPDFPAIALTSEGADVDGFATAHALAQSPPTQAYAADQAGETMLIGLFTARRYSEAAAMAADAVAFSPEWGAGWNVLGAALLQLGQLQHALQPMQRAAALLPRQADVHSNLGNLLRLLGHAGAATASCRQAIALMPGFAEAHINLGNALHDLGEHEAALASYRQALEINPEHPGAYANIGTVLLQTSRYEEAAASLQRAVQLRPDYVEAHNNLGNAFKKTGRFEQAAASYRAALDLAPEFPDAHSNLGNVLRDLGELDAAIAHCRAALLRRPRFAEACLNLGSALKDAGQLHEAVTSYEAALSINPDLLEAHLALGVAMLELRQFERAQACMRRALELDPKNAEARCALGVALQELGQIDAALAQMRQALTDDPEFLPGRSNLLFTSNLATGLDAAQLLAEARRYGDLAARRAKTFTAWSNVPDAGRCLRVGLVSGDLRVHPVAYFIDSVLAALAQGMAGRLEIVAYSTHHMVDAMTERLKTHCSAWRNVAGMTDERLAALVRSDAIDILIDLSGHTAHNRLSMFAWKPAPVQASWLGYMATTGIATMDYVIADPWSVPQGGEAGFTEQVWRLPHTCLCLSPPEVDVDVSALPALANGGVTFGSFNNLTKINDAVVAVWARVLLAVPGSRLLLKSKQFDAPDVRQAMAARFAQHGIGGERLMLEGFGTRRAHFESFHRVDLALDPFPYPGVTTTAETLWMSVPVLVRKGERMLPRLGLSLATNAGLADWIAADDDDYVARAVAHATDLPRLARLRATLRQQVLASPLFDAGLFARDFEAALRAMWAIWCNSR